MNKLRKVWFLSLSFHPSIAPFIIVAIITNSPYIFISNCSSCSSCSLTGILFVVRLSACLSIYLDLATLLTSNGNNSNIACLLSGRVRQNASKATLVLQKAAIEMEAEAETATAQRGNHDASVSAAA